MPAKSKSQQRLFGMALAVRRGEMKRGDVWKEVLDIVDSDMTDKEIEDFAKTKHDKLKEHKNMKDIKEYINEASSGDSAIDVREKGKYVYMYYDDTSGIVATYSMNSWRDMVDDFGDGFDDFAKALEKLKVGESYSDMDAIYCRIS